VECGLSFVAEDRKGGRGSGLSAGGLVGWCVVELVDCRVGGLMWGEGFLFRVICCAAIFSYRHVACGSFAPMALSC
jgi:hypothetical protein